MARPSRNGRVATEPQETTKSRPHLYEERIAAITEAMNDNPSYSNPEDIVKAIRRHGQGKSKLRDLSAEELESLHAEVESRGTVAASAEEAFPLLSVLLENPKLLQPPEQVVPRLAWRGRTTLHSAPDKAGKSTLWAHAAAAVSRGTLFLDERVPAGRVVWCGLEEAVGDAVRRFAALNANPERLRVRHIEDPELLQTLDALLYAWPADLLVIDSLTEYARVTRGSAPEAGDASGWGEVVRPLVALGRQRDCAVALVHHPRRSDGQYRGSGEIAAAVDCLWEMHGPQSGEDPTLRRFHGRARWQVEDWALRLEDGRYVVGGGGVLSLEARILADSAENPGTSRNAQHSRMRVRKATYLAVVKQLVEAAALRDDGGRLYVPGDVEDTS